MRPDDLTDLTPETMAEQTPPEATEYRSPVLVPLGEAARLIRNDGGGHLVDGTGGWWVWNS